MPLISSRTNPKIKAVRSLRQRKARSQSGLFLVEGIRHVGEAAEAGANLQAIYYSPALLDSPLAQSIIEKQKQNGVACYAVSADVFTSLAEKENPQGILAVVHKPTWSLSDFSPIAFPWGVALVSPQDPGNLGAILRTIDAVDASGLILLDGGADPFHPSAVRASMGTLFWHPVISASFDEFAHWVEEKGYHVYGTSAHAEIDYHQVGDYSPPCILLLGSEREGLTARQTDVCDFVVQLPMLGKATSLNLAVAAGVMLYTMLSKPGFHT
jgi:TrmH family RNA methyltransferase